MSADKLVEKRLQHFRQQIRAQQIQKIFQYHRRNLTISNNSISQTSSLCFPKHNPEPQTVIKALNQYKQILIAPFKNQMLDENSPGKHVAIEMHINFWQQCLFWLQHNKPNQYLIIPLLTNFILEVKQSYCWKQANVSKHLLDLCMELIQKICFQFQDQTKKSLAQWISDVKYISLIQKLFTSTQEFPSPQLYPNIYKIIVEALESPVVQYHKNSVHFILQVAKYANSTQNFLIFKYRIGIFTRLFQLIEENCNSIQAMNYWPPIFYLLNNYSQVLEYAANQGLIEICCKLIKSNLQDNVFGALAILKVLSCGQTQVINKIQSNLSQNEQNWLSICLDLNLYQHDKMDISKLFFQIVRNLIVWSNEKFLILLCSIFQKKRKSIIGLISSVWQTSRKDQDTVNFTLECVSALLAWNQILLFDQQSIQVFLQSKNMMPFISKCQMSQNQKISDNASCILDQMERIDKKKVKQSI